MSVSARAELVVPQQERSSTEKTPDIKSTDYIRIIFRDAVSVPAPVVAPRRAR